MRRRCPGLSVEGTTVSLTFNENLAATTAAQRSQLSYAFTVQGGRYLGTPVENQSPDVGVSGATVTLRLGSGVPPGAEVSVSYDAARAARLGASLRDADGNAVGSFERTLVAGTTAGTVRPLLVGARVAGTVLTLTFDRDLDADSAPAGRRFSVLAEPFDGRGPSRWIRGTGAARVGGEGGRGPGGRAGGAVRAGRCVVPEGRRREPLAGGLRGAGGGGRLRVPGGDGARRRRRRSWCRPTSPERSSCSTTARRWTGTRRRRPATSRCARREPRRR